MDCVCVCRVSFKDVCGCGGGYEFGGCRNEGPNHKLSEVLFSFFIQPDIIIVHVQEL